VEWRWLSKATQHSQQAACLRLGTTSVAQRHVICLHHHHRTPQGLSNPLKGSLPWAVVLLFLGDPSLPLSCTDRSPAGQFQPDQCQRASYHKRIGAVDVARWGGRVGAHIAAPSVNMFITINPSKRKTQTSCDLWCFIIILHTSKYDKLCPKLYYVQDTYCTSFVVLAAACSL